jgi:hypothetical protein
MGKRFLPKGYIAKRVEKRAIKMAVLEKKVEIFSPQPI